MKNRWIVGTLILILGVLIAVGPHSLFKVCEGLLADGKPMKCHWTAMASIGIGSAIEITGILLIIFKQRQARMAFSIAIALLGALVIIFPTVLIGVCATASMPCHALTLPVLCVIGSILIIISLANAVYLGREERE